MVPGNVLVLWNHDPKDYQMADASELTAWVTTQPLSPGDIVLLHDTHAHTAAALPQLLGSGTLRFLPLDVR